MKKLILLLLFSLSVLFAQDLTGYKICINPGHGGHDSNDRWVQETGFWESESNLSKGLLVKHMLENLGVNVVITRSQNRTQDDLPLSQIVTIANANSVDHMHSIHSNAFSGQSNYTLLLFQGSDTDPTFDEAKAFGAIMSDMIKTTHRTTAKYNRGDFTFYGTGTAYLGVFKGLTMPGTLSEGSFHDYFPESWRLRNTAYHQHEAWAIVRSFLQHYNAGSIDFGFIAGLVRDAVKTVSYFTISSTNDRNKPVNAIHVRIAETGEYYDGDFNNNGFFLFDSMTPGNYTLIYNAEGYEPDTQSVSVVANTTAFADIKLQQTASLPVTPDQVSAYAHGQSINIACNSVSNATQYILYYGTEYSALFDTLQSEEPSFSITDWPELTPFYFNLRSANDAGISPRISTALYASATGPEDKMILFIDAFDRNSYFNNSFDYIRKYASEITANGYGFHSIQNDALLDGTVDLTDYHTIIWMSGNESSADETFSNTEQVAVASFLKQGGRLFVSGSEIAWDLQGYAANASEADIAFLNNYLKCKYASDAPGDSPNYYYTVEPIADSDFAGITKFNTDDGTHGTYNVGYADGLYPLNGSHRGLKFKDVSYARATSCLYYRGFFPDGSEPGKLVFFSIPFETIYPDSARQELMDLIITYFDDPATDADDIIPDRFELGNAYPNPFNATVTIPFSLPENQSVTLSIYDLNGRLVQTLLTHRNYNRGQYQVRWNGKNTFSQTVASGVYLVQLHTPDNISVRKITLLK